MKVRKVLYWLIGVLSALLLLVAAAIIFLDPILKTVAQRRIQAQTGLRTEIGGLTVKFTEARVALKDLKLYNSADFGGTILMDIPELAIELDSDQASAGKLRFKFIRFALNEFSIVRDKSGRLNLDAFNKAKLTNSVSSGRSSGKGFEFAGIEKISLSLGKLKYTDLRDSGRNEEIELGVQNEIFENIGSEAEFKNWYGALCVRLVLQVITQQMLNAPDRSQRFGELLKELKGSVPLDL